MGFDAAVRAPAVGQIRGEVRAPLHAGVLHAEPIEDPALHFLADIQAEPALDRELQQDQALAGVGVARARIEMHAQLAVGFDEGEIRETDAVRQRVARRDGTPARIVGEVDPGRVLTLGRIVGQRLVEIARQRRVEIESSLIHELHDHVGEGRLGQ